MEKIELNRELNQIEWILDSIIEVQRRIYNSFVHHRVYSQKTKDEFTKINAILGNEYHTLYARFATLYETMADQAGKSANEGGNGTKTAEDPMTVTINFRDEKVAVALAQACKRFSTTTADELAADEREADRIMDAVQDLREGLANAGYAPR